jgi:molybdopterin-binding protein
MQPCNWGQLSNDKQWIYKKKIRSNRTAGGHHRIPQSEVDRLLFRTRGKTEQQRKEEIRRVSGRNQLVGRIDSVQISGLMAEVRISIGGQQITSIITARSAREMQVKRGQTAAALVKAIDVMILREMKNRLFLSTLLFALILDAVIVQSQQLSVQIEVGR